MPAGQEIPARRELHPPPLTVGKLEHIVPAHATTVAHAAPDVRENAVVRAGNEVLRPAADQLGPVVARTCSTAGFASRNRPSSSTITIAS